MDSKQLIGNIVLLFVLGCVVWYIWSRWGIGGEGFGTARVPIFVISMLDRRPERAREMRERIREDPRYYIADIGAVDGRKHLREGFIDGHGQIGCFLSHIGIWGRLARMGPGVEWALVLEDDADVRLPEDWDRVVEMAVENTPADWELLWIGVLNVVSPDKNIEVNSHVNVNNSVIWGTHAYLIKKSAAVKLYDRLRDYQSKHNVKDFAGLEAVDLYLSENKDVPLKQYVLSHDVIGQKNMGSDTNVHQKENTELFKEGPE